MSDFKKIDTLLKMQPKASDAPLSEEIEAYALCKSELEGLIVVVSDLVNDSSRIYAGGFAAEMGLDGYETENSIWEKRIFELMPEAQRQEKFKAELRFFNSLRRMPKQLRRYHYLASHLRFITCGGKEIDVVHTMYYVYADDVVRFAVCTYGPLSFGFTGKSVIVNSRTGVTEPLTRESDAEILTRRELQTLSLIAAGRKSREIASLLSISQHTVNRHRQEIMIKLQAKSSLEAINIAKSLGIL